MTPIVPGRTTAELDGDFVVFLVGIRINRWSKIHRWWPVAMAMPRMLKELAAHPGTGCLATRNLGGTIVQYRRSLEAFDA